MDINCLLLPKKRLQVFSSITDGWSSLKCNGFFKLLLHTFDMTNYFVKLCDLNPHMELRIFLFVVDFALNVEFQGKF